MGLRPTDREVFFTTWETKCGDCGAVTIRPVRTHPPRDRFCGCGSVITSKAQEGAMLESISAENIQKIREYWKDGGKVSHHVT